ncbi:MAG: MqnA/MqnD/SBP family protein [Planctomycetota bacterium]
MTTLRLAHSPDSDDLVMWWPLVGMRGPDGEPVAGELGTPRVDTRGFGFELVARDVEELNKIVVEGRDTAYHVTAISAAAYPAVRDRWRITRCGASFGEGYGPRVVVREDSRVRGLEDLFGTRVAVPGLNTSAYLALSLALRRARGHGGAEGRSGRGFEGEAMLFSNVPGAVLDGRFDAGVLIHEAQLTFGELGLRKVLDLGEWWTGATGLPLPLGLNVIRRDVDPLVAAVLSDSVRYAATHRDECFEFLRLHSAGRPEWNDRALVDEYLDKYVSGLTVDMGGAGAGALERFLGDGAAAGFCGEAGEVDVV